MTSTTQPRAVCAPGAEGRLNRAPSTQTRRSGPGALTSGSGQKGIDLASYVPSAGSSVEIFSALIQSGG